MSTEPSIYPPIDFKHILRVPMTTTQHAPCRFLFTGLTPKGLRLHDTGIVVTYWEGMFSATERTGLCDAGLSFLRSISDGLTVAENWPQPGRNVLLDGTTNYHVEARNTGLGKVSLAVVPRLSLTYLERDTDVWRRIAEDLNELFDAIRANVLNRDPPPVNLLDF